MTEYPPLSIKSIASFRWAMLLARNSNDIIARSLCIGASLQNSSAIRTISNSTQGPNASTYSPISASPCIDPNATRAQYSVGDNSISGKAHQRKYSGSPLRGSGIYITLLNPRTLRFHNIYQKMFITIVFYCLRMGTFLTQVLVRLLCSSCRYFRKACFGQ